MGNKPFSIPDRLSYRIAGIAGSCRVGTAHRSPVGWALSTDPPAMTGDRWAVPTLQKATHQRHAVSIARRPDAPAAARLSPPPARVSWRVHRGHEHATPTTGPVP